MPNYCRSGFGNMIVVWSVGIRFNVCLFFTPLFNRVVWFVHVLRTDMVDKLYCKIYSPTESEKTLSEFSKKNSIKLCPLSKCLVAQHPVAQSSRGCPLSDCPLLN